MNPISCVTPCTWDGKDGWKLTEQLQRFAKTAKCKIMSCWYLRALCYGLMAAALFGAWLLLDGGSVAFVYSEF